MKRSLVTWPRSRAGRSQANRGALAARSCLAGGRSSHRCGYQLAKWWHVASARVDARELVEESRPVVCPRAELAGGPPWRSLRGQIRKFLLCVSIWSEAISNCAIKPTPEQAIRSNRALRPARLIAALGI